MTYIKEYWDNKEMRAKQAQKHTAEMRSLYSGAISSSIKNTKIYTGDLHTANPEDKGAEIIVDDLDTVAAGYKYRSGKTALLNFSSYKEPGGMFIAGSKAQEECLCHASYLYNVLVTFTDTFYAWNNQHKNKALYLNRALYSPAIVFEANDDTYLCDVITCAAPNKTAAQKYQNVTDQENSVALRSRIKFVLDIAANNNIDILILGAYGCGVFGQDPREVAGIFREYLNTTHKNCFEKVVFAIPDGTNGNFKAFREVFQNDH